MERVRSIHYKVMTKKTLERLINELEGLEKYCYEEKLMDEEKAHKNEDENSTLYHYYIERVEYYAGSENAFAYVLRKLRAILEVEEEKE